MIPNKTRYNLLKQVLSKAIPILAFTFLISGCMNVQVEMGRKVNPSNIESALRLKESTQDEVKSLLGTHDGVGVYVSPITGKFYTMWTYFFAEGSTSELNDVNLFVYFDRNVYEGFLWFSNNLKKPGSIKAK